MYVKQTRPLDSWLNLVGLMPFDEKLPPIESASPQAVIDVNELWTDALANHPELGVPHISENHPDLRYELFRRVREYLETIAAVASDPSVKRPLTRYGTLMDPRMLDLESLPPSDRRRVMLCGSGIFVAADPYGMFLTNLEQTGEDVWKLKLCPVCAAPFLPHREDQKACSLRCANTYRVRRTRQDKKKTARPLKIKRSAR
jgi:hypothetical protein